ncbi:DUF4134 domain-containing protein [Pseudoflavitalea rhizosphaerae]|uniref:DUF4134 domain-containing protein n=1 Tax=Pseudoflavitalea rhizosphaerae TaxID=1884793 RepID=UPI000F8E8675|nr:DUF4134 domain-containing protein [Pseudoflavitalea rhizosphaerae]
MLLFSKGNRSFLIRLFCLKSFALSSITSLAQTPSNKNGNEGIKKAAEMVSGYFDDGTTLLYAIGAIVGIVGAVRVYNKWSSGDQDTAKAAAAWFGACIFLVVVATVLKSFYGLK